MLHETGAFIAWYLPLDNVRLATLESSERRNSDRFKGEATDSIIGKEATLVPLDLSSLLDGGCSRDFRIFDGERGGWDVGRCDDHSVSTGFGSSASAIGFSSCGHIHGVVKQPSPHGLRRSLDQARRQHRDGFAAAIIL